MSDTRRPGQSLVFDADDTLWDNNVLFERVIADYLEWLAHPTLDRETIRDMLDDIERANIVTHGYGTVAFLHNLGECLERLQERPTTAQQREDIDRLAHALVHHEVELMPGVSDTLADLGARHRLYLLTKGDPAEQQRKIDASGLAEHFGALHIVREKDAAVYRELTGRHDFDPASTWMIGNSPRSDILPARAAGWNAVFIPQEITWSLERAELDPGDDRVLVLAAFPDLRDHF
jgi:putative hydrolase of the HAD superfamily